MSNASRFYARGTRGEVWLYDAIGSGWFGGISAKDFQKELAGLGAVNQLDVHINSPGGAVFDGLTMYNALRAHRAEVTVHVDGLAASIASVIAMAGATVHIADNAMMMIHDPYTFTEGTADDHRKTADLLDSLKTNLVDIYARRTGQTDAVVREWMAAETWFTAAEARDQRLADEVTEALDMAASHDVSRFRRPPERLLAHQAPTPRLDQSRVRLKELGQRLARWSPSNP